MELAPKTYRGQIVYPRVPRLEGPPPQYGRQFTNVAVIPGTRAVNHMIINQQAYRMSYRGMSRPWDPPAKRNMLKTVIRTDVANLSSDDAVNASSIKQYDSDSEYKSIRKRYR